MELYEIKIILPDLFIERILIYQITLEQQKRKDFIMNYY